MTTMLDTELEGTGENFSLDALMDVRARTRKAVHLIADQVKPGMAEEEAKAIARDTLKELGMRRGWHHIIVRCGSNTTKDFMEKSEPGVILGENDIFFVDIGPIYGETEGDAGDTFVFGDDPDHLRAKREVRQIWDEVRDTWFASGINGKELYDVAIETAAGYGWNLNMDLSGHRLSDFPHSAHYDGPLAEVTFRPNPEPVGARDRHRPPRASLRRLLRGPAPRGPVLPGLIHQGQPRRRGHRPDIPDPRYPTCVGSSPTTWPDPVAGRRQPHAYPHHSHRHREGVHDTMTSTAGTKDTPALARGPGPQTERAGLPRPVRTVGRRRSPPP